MRLLIKYGLPKTAEPKLGQRSLHCLSISNNPPPSRNAHHIGEESVKRWRWTCRKLAGIIRSFMPIRVITETISIREIKALAEERFGDMVKMVVDLTTEHIAFGGDMHADEEATLLERGSAQQDLWGINYYPERPLDDRVEFDSMINIRPSAGNRSRTVEDQNIRQKIRDILAKKIIL